MNRKYSILIASILQKSQNKVAENSINTNKYPKNSNSSKKLLVDRH